MTKTDIKAMCVFTGGLRVFLVLIIMGTWAWAQSEPGDGAPEPEQHQNGLDEDNGDGESGQITSRPWAEGVSEEDQRIAKEIFEEANGLLSDSLFIKAAEKYREALEHWPHPAIYYNLALALLNLDQPLEVYAALENAMKHGPAPLDMDKFERARSYKQLVMKQLATVEVVCDEKGAKVTMDGKELFTGPGRHKELVRIGEHNFIATKAGYIPTNQTIVLEPGQNAAIALRLFTDADLTTSVRRWDSWKPWALVSAGVAFVAAGGTFHYLSTKSFDEFDVLLKERCPQGCPSTDPEYPSAEHDRAHVQQNIAIGTYIAGGVALTTGVILVVLNRPKLLRVDVTASEERRASIIPLIAPDKAGLAAQFRF